MLSPEETRPTSDADDTTRDTIGALMREAVGVGGVEIDAIIERFLSGERSR